jgi:hypothetical protein
VNESLDIVYFSAIKWEFLWQRPQAISEAMAEKDCRVFYIEPPASRRHHNEKGQVRKVQDNLYVVIPPSLLFPHYLRSLFYMSKRYDQRLFLKWFRQFESRFDIGQRGNIISAPYWWDEILPASYYKESHSSLLFDCYDDYPNLSVKFKRIRIRSRVLAKKERAIIQHADLCLATSEALKKKVLSIRNDVKVAMVPNGVDFDYYHRILTDQAAGKPEDMKTIAGFTFGFVGALGDWVDFSLILQAAQKFPQFEFVLIGPLIGVDVSLLQKCPNIHFLGEKRKEDIPYYIKAMDVCLVPFRKIDRLDTINSNKLYQYIAMGKPIIGVESVETRKLNSFIETYDTVEEFNQRLSAAPDIPVMEEERIEFAKSNSWKKRAEVILTEANRSSIQSKEER